MYELVETGHAVILIAAFNFESYRILDLLCALPQVLLLGDSDGFNIAALTAAPSPFPSTIMLSFSSLLVLRTGLTMGKIGVWRR